MFMKLCSKSLLHFLRSWVLVVRFCRLWLEKYYEYRLITNHQYPESHHHSTFIANSNSI